MYACTAQYSTGQYAFPEECQKITSWTMAEGGFVRGVCRQAARYGQQGHWTGTGASIQGRPGGWGRQQRRKGAKIIPDNHAAERITAKIQKFHLNRELLCPYSPPPPSSPRRTETHACMTCSSVHFCLLPGPGVSNLWRWESINALQLVNTPQSGLVHSPQCPLCCCAGLVLFTCVYM
jgi:hypothetical protein